MNTWNHGLRLAVILLASLAMAAVTRAQETVPAPPPPAPAGGDVFYMAVPDGGPMPPPEAIEFVEFAGGVGGKTVTGAPFTATISNQSSQTLPDGNHIQRNTTGTFSRDAQGRTRRDITFSGFGPWVASGNPGKQVSMINDPVAGVHYMLDPSEKIAHKFSGGKWKDRGKKRAPGGAAAGAASAPQELPNAVTTSLGTKPINGISAEGTQITRTIPAGAIGNEKPIVITVERWYSPDLQTTVLVKRSDPRTGDSSFQLTNIQRQEPDASLFQVPADYTVKTGPPPSHRKRVPLPVE
jgi:hypothetical protein